MVNSERKVIPLRLRSLRGRKGWARSLLGKAASVELWVERLLHAIGAVVVAVVAILVCAELSQRALTGRSFPWLVDFIEVSVAAFVLASLPYLQTLRSHVRMSMFIERLKGKPAYDLVELLISLFGIIVSLALIWAGYLVAFQAIVSGEKTITYDIPRWPSKTLFPIVAALLMIRFAVQAVGHARVLISRPATLQEKGSTEVR